MHAPSLHSARGGYYIGDAERRSRLYISPAAAWRAWERGERLTDAEYRAASEVTHSATKGARRVR